MIFLIADMIIPLTRRQALRRWRKFAGQDPEWLGKPGLQQDLFTCRHWDETTRLCTAYEQRPRMCREFPYGRTCETCGYCNLPAPVLETPLHPLLEAPSA